MDTRPAINVTPLIDVLLVLLIIFMVISPAKPSQIETKLPAEAKNAPKAETNPDTLVINIKSDLSFELNKEKSYSGIDELPGLRDYLASIFRKRKQNNAFGDDGTVQRTVFVKAPRTLEYGTVVKFIDIAKVAGAQPVALQLDNLD